MAGSAVELLSEGSALAVVGCLVVDTSLVVFMAVVAPLSIDFSLLFVSEVIIVY